MSLIEGGDAREGWRRERGNGAAKLAAAAAECTGRKA